MTAKHPDSRAVFAALIVLFPALYLPAGLWSATNLFTAEDVHRTRTCTAAEISPDGKWVAYIVSVPRNPQDPPGSAYSELHLASTQTETTRPFIAGKTSIGSVQWSPHGSSLAFLTTRGEGSVTQVWTIPLSGGEARQVTRSETPVLDFRWHPSGKKIAYVAIAPKTRQERDLDRQGYGFVFFEENLKHRNLYLVETGGDMAARQLTEGLSAWSFEFSPDGDRVAVSTSSKNLVDHSFMFRKIHILDLATKTLTQLTDNPGKLGNFAFSPDGGKLVYTAALERHDHAVSQVFVIPVSGGAARNLTPAGFAGHVSWAGWRDSGTVVYLSGEGVWSTLSQVPAVAGNREVLLHARDAGVVFGAPSHTRDFGHLAMTGSSPEAPGDPYYWSPGGKAKRLADLNPWLAERRLGRQEVIRYRARDGREIEGLLISPVNSEEGARYPLIVVVHGGPESHYFNGWLTSYANPGQVFAGKGYLTFYPNYRSSTGYGLDFALTGLEDPAGVEFDDIADGIEHLASSGRADPQRVGLTGGSYGGYAAAWFSSFYTKMVRAVCMFVGISNLVSRLGTTDIPYEEFYVHSGKRLEEMWEKSLQRSPIYWAHQSRSAVLILGGTDDTRVHPAQSMEYYRRLQMNDHPAVRLVQYPGEGHGNRRQPGQLDVLFRQLDWFDWYVKDAKPLDGPMPPLDISNRYGLSLEK